MALSTMPTPGAVAARRSLTGRQAVLCRTPKGGRREFTALEYALMDAGQITRTPEVRFCGCGALATEAISLGSRGVRWYCWPCS